MADLFAKKPLDRLLNEAQETGRAQSETDAWRLPTHRAGSGRDYWSRHFRVVGTGRALCRSGAHALFRLVGTGMRIRGLCYAEFAAMIPLAGSAYTYAYATLGEIFAWIIGWDLTLEYAMGASTVSSGWSNHFIELLNIFHIKMPLWLAYDHWTGLRTAENIVARQMAQASDATLVPGTQAFLNKVTAIMACAIAGTDAARARLAGRAQAFWLSKSALTFRLSSSR